MHDSSSLRAQQDGFYMRINRHDHSLPFRSSSDNCLKTLDHFRDILLSMGKQESQRVFGGVVRRLRNGLRISQERLAEEAGLHRTYVSLLERGLRNPSLTVIQQLAAALKVTTVELIRQFESRSRGSGL
jgi:DNA-binding XRE family transcriptional regulator